MTKSEPSKSHAVLWVGGPDAGKTNFLGRLWMTLDGEQGLIAKDGLPAYSEYLNVISDFLLRGEYAPHTGSGNFLPSSISVKWNDPVGKRFGELVIPDCGGEQWEKITESREWSQHWEDAARNVTGCLIFVRANSEHYVPALDWASHEHFLNCMGSAGADDKQKKQPKLPTQVLLIDWLECLYSVHRELGDPAQALRVAIVVSAWDMIREDNRNEDPVNYIDANFPMFHDFISTNTNRFNAKIFGASVAGGDLLDSQPGFKEKYLAEGPNEKGYILYSHESSVKRSSDFTLPLSWALGCF